MLETFFPDQEFKALLFDFDGTVADTMPGHLLAWNQALATYGQTMTRDQHQAWAGRPTREIVTLLNELHGLEMIADVILREKEIAYFNSFASITEIVPIMKIVRDNFGRVPMAIVSGSRRDPVQRTLKQLGLENYFQPLVCAEDYTHGKPAPDCFLMAARALNVAPESCLVFEDGELGIQAAHAAGMACVRVEAHPELGHRLSAAVRFP